MEKYRFKEKEALAFADFLLPCLQWDPDKRITAEKLLDHPWLKMAPEYDVRISDEEY
jgi:serine/threonine-protein kinase SRPK3